MNRERLIYYFVRTITFPCKYLPNSVLHRLGKLLGTIAFHFMREYRKRALSNLALANDLKLTRKNLYFYAKKSFQNLAINCLEYPKFAHKKDLSKIIRCENPEVASAIYNQGKGIIFFCGHQSNWEVLFLDGTARMHGTAIGKAIKNKWLYQWITSIRERNGGKIITPRNAMKEGLRALKKGHFLGIVGDQGMPDSGYSFPFLGRRAWTSTAPALLAYRTGSPIIFASTRRVKGGYVIHYHEPIWPNLERSMEEEIPSLMDQLLFQLQESIKKSPGEWLWQHNRWKQQTIHNLYKRFRQDCICIILPKKGFNDLLVHLSTLKEIYSKAFLILLVPQEHHQEKLIDADEIIYYNKKEETLLDDLRFKLVFNFTDYKKIHEHYETLSAFEVLNIPMIYDLAKEHAKLSHNFSDILKRALCKPGTIWKREEHAG